MLLWTVQPVAVLDALREQGRLGVDPYKVNPEGWIHPQYTWLAKRMKERLPGCKGGLPWFAYCKRPDLRWVRHSRPKGSREALVELEVPDGRYLAFPCWAWHLVFTCQFLATSPSGNHAWNARLKAAEVREDEYPLPRKLQRELEASWLGLFDPALPARGKREAAVEELEWAMVRSVKKFTGTFNPPHIPSGSRLGR